MSESITSESIPSVEAPRPAPAAIVIPAGLLVYALLLALSLTLRLGELGAVPLSSAEAPTALSAYESLSPLRDAATLSLPGSPLGFWSARVGMGLLGSTELAARLLTALAGALLGLTPLLFRDLLGPGRAFAFSLLLSLSPVLLAASRTSDPAVWSLLLAVLMLWRLKVYAQTRTGSAGVALIVALGALLGLSEAGALPLSVSLLLALAGAAILSTTDRSPEPEADSDADPVRRLDALTAALIRLPWLNGVGLAALVLLSISTGFLTFPAGLSMVGGALGAGVGGFFNFDPAGAFAVPLSVSLFYEPLLWAFAGVGLWLSRRADDAGFVDRFFALWLLGGVLMALIWGTGGAGHALWLSLPLAGLASRAVVALFSVDRMQSLWADSIDDPDIGQLYTVAWGKWLLAGVSFGLYAMLSVHLNEIGREILLVEGGMLSALVERLTSGASPGLQTSTLWTFIALSFLLVGYFLAAGVWGPRTTLQGMGLGLLAFLLMGGVAAGWQAVVFRADDPREPWQQGAAVSPSYNLLRDRLDELSIRETQGEPYLPLTLVIPPQADAEFRALMGWLARDYVDVTTVSAIDAARAAPVILVAESLSLGLDPANINPELGANYVGRRFIIGHTWSPAGLRGLDLLPWMLSRETRTNVIPQRSVTLWLRMDIYTSAEEDSDVE